MTHDKHREMTDGVIPDGDMVQIPLANLEAAPHYRSQLRDMDSLVNSIYYFGVLNPLWVEPHRSIPSKYVVFAGRRRFLAAREAAERKARESDSPEGLAVQVGRYTVPCQVFRNLDDTKRVLYPLVENLMRTRLSTSDLARQIALARRLFEKELGRKVSIEEIMTLLEGRGQQPDKLFARRKVYRLLRVADMDQRVLDEARRDGVANACLEWLAVLKDPNLQIGLIESVQRDGLTRKEVRTLVGEILSLAAGQVDLPAMIAELRSGAVPPLEGKRPAQKGVAPDRQILGSG